MTTFHENDFSTPLSPSITTVTPWCAVSMGLLGLIMGFALHRFIIPTTLGASVGSQIPTSVAQGIIVQPSASPPPPAPAGGGCGCGAGGSCGALAPNAPKL